jgi:hypothetical protein
MSDQDKSRPITTSEEVERTGRDEQVAGVDANEGFGAAGSKREQRDGLDENDAPPGGIDSAEFPGAGAP